MNSPDNQVAAAIQSVQQSPRDLGRWFRLLEVLVRFGRHAQLLHVLEQRQVVAGDALSVAYDGLGRVLIGGEVDAVDAFLLTIPPNHIFMPIALMLRGWAAAAREDADETVRLTRRAVAMVPAIKSFVEKDIEFQRRVYPLMVNQDEQIDLASEILAPGEAEMPPSIALDPVRTPGADRVVVAAADAQYAKRFAIPFVQSFRQQSSPDMILHLHVITPDQEANEILAAAKTEEPRLHVSTQAADIEGQFPVYCASSRFLITPLLLKYYRLPLLLTDIDITFTRPITDITSATTKLDIGLFETGSAAPPLRCSAVAVHIAQSDGADRFIELLTRYLRTKLRRDRNWMLDQSALWAVSRACRKLSDPISYGNLTEALGAGWDAFIAPIPVTAAEKRELRWGPSNEIEA